MVNLGFFFPSYSKRSRRRNGILNVLVVVDGEITYSRDYFGLSNLLENFQTVPEWWYRVQLTLAHRGDVGLEKLKRFLGRRNFRFRNADPNPRFRFPDQTFADDSGKKSVKAINRRFRRAVKRAVLKKKGLGWGLKRNFVFRTRNLQTFDEIWLFGYEPSSPTEPSSYSLEELEAIRKWMDEKKGGIFACGDHSRLGGDLCGEVPRVRLMQKWHSGDPPRDPITRENRFPNTTILGGLDNPRTLNIDESRIVEDSDQSDDVPMRITPIPFGRYHINQPFFQGGGHYSLSISHSSFPFSQW